MSSPQLLEQLDQALPLLACPVCQSELRRSTLGAGTVKIHCQGCGREYPVKDGIAVLISESARKTIIEVDKMAGQSPLQAPSQR